MKLDYNRITDVSAEILIKDLSNSLVELDLSGNPIGLNGCKILGNYLK